VCGFIPSHIPSQSRKCKCDSQVALLACVFPCFCFGCELKVKVMTLILCIENTYETRIYQKMPNPCDICSFIGLYFIYQHIFFCVKRIFNTWYSCVKWTNLWMNEFCMIFIIISSHAKFVTTILISLLLTTWRNRSCSR